MTVADSKPRLIVLAGPTAVGKTELALQLASAAGGEIISADAMQVYRLMDIGTAKPTAQQRSLVKHHLLDVADPDEPFNAALFIKHAQPVIEALHAERKPIFVVGGTGLYIRALLGGLFDGPQADETLRTSYREALSAHGPACLYEELKKKDEQAARRIHPRDAVRIMRALEVLEISGKSIVEQHRQHHFGGRRYDYLKIGFMLERQSLFDRIGQRAEQMMAGGFVEEVRRLLEMGYTETLKSMQSLGYRHVVRYLHGLQDLSTTVQIIKRDTRRYAKRQMTWFGSDREMIWFKPDDRDAIVKTVSSFLSERPDRGNHGGMNRQAGSGFLESSK
ncbi:MAG: tRNA (adenosine(37)-N6)-dimethylallyltransferase MiaA [Deltaproteobacteria bacterium HGW-Deltaproteobacteria-11]|nr:MAG: tRNA (adenosine(37)-N6)-dimethylallyltransferase MiaA [Deltaproteobacteria bacterium HGW-Deltaproteobacteria-11]